MASVPSLTAIEISDTSARVGAGFEIIDSSMLVATMTGLPLNLQPCTLEKVLTRSSERAGNVLLVMRSF